MKNRNKLVLAVTIAWGILAGLNETGVLDLLPFEDEKINDWIRFIVAFLLVILNAKYYIVELSNKTVGNRPNDRTVGNRPDDRLPDCPECECVENCARNK